MISIIAPFVKNELEKISLGQIANLHPVASSFVRLVDTVSENITIFHASDEKPDDGENQENSNDLAQ